MQSLDRLFGRQISNLPQLPHHLKQPPKHKHLRSMSFNYDQHRPHAHKSYRESLNPNVSHKQQKPKIPKEQPPATINLQEKLTDYFDEVISIMLQQEANAPDLNNYLQKHSDITPTMRTILLDWLLDVHLKFKMFPQTLFIVVHIVDRYLSLKNIKKQQLQLVGAAALFIAAKYEETYQVPDITELVNLSAKAFTKQDLLRTEADIMDKMNFNIVFNTPYHFLSPLCVLANFDHKKICLAQYTLELALMDHHFLKYKGSMLAASSIYLINKIKRNDVAWSDALMAASGYSESELRVCAKELCHLMQMAEHNANTKCLRRKFSLPKYAQVAKIRLEKRDKNNN